MTETIIDGAGRSLQKAEQACREFPNLTLVTGFYHCPKWGKQPHSWTKFPDGEIHDPTVKQFPTAGEGARYEEVSCGS